MVLYCTVKAHRVGRRQNRSDHPNQWQNCWKTKYMWHPRHATQTCHTSSHTSRKGYLGIQLRSNQCTISYIWKLQIIPISLNISSFQNDGLNLFRTHLQKIEGVPNHKQNQWSSPGWNSEPKPQLGVWVGPVWKWIFASLSCFQVVKIRNVVYEHCLNSVFLNDSEQLLQACSTI